jgi:predicted ribosomally synthesized peptide with nif11-like leader
LGRRGKLTDLLQQGRCSVENGPNVNGPNRVLVMALDQLKQFLLRMQNDPALRQAVQAAATADDVAQLAGGLGFEFSGDELLRFSGQKVGRVTVTKQDIPGEYS